MPARDISSARHLFASLKAALARGDDDSDEWTDERYDLITEIHGWAIDESQPNGRVEAYVIVLAERVKDEDAANLTRLLTLIDGVASVVPVENNLGELTRSWRCWDVPTPAQYEDLGKALAVAEHAYRAHHGLDRISPLPGDWCEIHALDDVLRVQFKLKETRRNPDA